MSDFEDELSTVLPRFLKKIHPKIINCTFDLKKLYVIKTNILIQIIVISAIEKYNPAKI